MPKRKKKDVPLSLWWINFDEPYPLGLFVMRDELATLSQCFMECKYQYEVQGTDKDDILYFDFAGVTRLVAHECSMKTIMKCIRRNNIHGHYRKAGEITAYKF